MSYAAPRYRFYPGVGAPTQRPAISSGAAWATQAAIQEPPSYELDLDTTATMDARASKTSRYQPANGRASDSSVGKEAAASHGRAKGTKALVRAPKVTGSFDHALLPMPPVSASTFLYSIRGSDPDDLVLSYPIEEDGYTRDGFSLVLCYCG